LKAPPFCKCSIADRAGIFGEIELGEIDVAIGELIENLTGESFDAAQFGRGKTLSQRGAHSTEDRPRDRRLRSNMQSRQPFPRVGSQGVPGFRQ